MDGHEDLERLEIGWENRWLSGSDDCSASELLPDVDCNRLKFLAVDVSNTFKANMI